ncbi:hypothetical protein ABVN58_10700 [Fusobacterium polymorphum]|uniref:Uncharacterized protein n=1 Tax=Fusobacterium nucleatum CTI-6 TaxID=1316587 RepID=U7TXV8_FUSNU|nr:hypothetical protein [Fusobacterium nucleatum]ERT48737.1 hypothetical protein HMPREF1767_00547 [Fusobacterium nucleatum CTI-6]
MIAFFLTVLIMMATIGGLFTFFEICILRLFFKIENFKYVKLLKKLEIAVFLFAFIMLTSLKIPTILLSLIYFLILIYDFYKKKIDIKNFIINFIFLFVDFYVMNLVIIKLPKNYLIFKNLYGII